VVDNIEAAVAKVKASGCKFRDEITPFSPTLKLAFFWGPDNVLIELIERS
jgi:predicted enzyme related to lactoylglutathione lyase